MTNERRIRILRNGPQNRKCLVILQLKIQRLTNSVLCKVIVWICCKCEFRFLQSLVESPDVTVHESKLVTCFIQSWIKLKRASIFPYSPVVRKMIRWCP